MNDSAELVSLQQDHSSTWGDPNRHAQFLDFYMIHQSIVRTYVRRLMPSRADTDDVMQEVALVLWAKFDQFREGGDFRTWAFGVARYQVLAWLRDRGRDRVVLAGDVVELIASEAMGDAANIEQQCAALRNCLRKLTPQHRALLLECYSSERKIQEIAATSGRSTAGFYQWLHRMRQILLDCVRQEVARSTCP